MKLALWFTLLSCPFAFAGCPSAQTKVRFPDIFVYREGRWPAVAGLK